ncbi:hypothetical protein POM88_019138 [Heracleum sosnowskyi]|uniref:Uncharacterized protein n=1 Tax=Heracleum sosnowskyi TaxID=360622 RepID=A0AAD8MVC5_9APIA|nr:hypothetical protein POM88_019138 [Heracleum sosnowskyi]
MMSLTCLHANQASREKPMYTAWIPSLSSHELFISGNTIGSCLPLILSTAFLIYLNTKCSFLKRYTYVHINQDGTTAKGHPGLGLKHQYVQDRSEHQSASKPTWTLALEIVTRVMVGSLFRIALFLAVPRCAVHICYSGFMLLSGAALNDENGEESKYQGNYSCYSAKNRGDPWPRPAAAVQPDWFLGFSLPVVSLPSRIDPQQTSALDDETVRAYKSGALYFVEVDIELPEDLALKDVHAIDAQYGGIRLKKAEHQMQEEKGPSAAGHKDYIYIQAMCTKDDYWQSPCLMKCGRKQSTCWYSSALALGLIAVVSLVKAQTIINVAAGCLCYRRGPILAGRWLYSVLLCPGLHLLRQFLYCYLVQHLMMRTVKSQSTRATTLAMF